MEIGFCRLDRVMQTLGLGFAWKCWKHNGCRSTSPKTQSISEETINKDTPQWENPISLINSLKNNYLQCHINRKTQLKP